MQVGNTCRKMSTHTSSATLRQTGGSLALLFTQRSAVTAANIRERKEPRPPLCSMTSMHLDYRPALLYPASVTAASKVAYTLGDRLFNRFYNTVLQRGVNTDQPVYTVSFTVLQPVVCTVACIKHVWYMQHATATCNTNMQHGNNVYSGPVLLGNSILPTAFTQCALLQIN